MSKEISETWQFKQKKRGGNSKKNEETQSDVILRFKPSKLNETQISVTFCHRPPRYVPYKGTYVPYDGTYGAPDQGQTLDV